MCVCVCDDTMGHHKATETTAHHTITNTWTHDTTTRRSTSNVVDKQVASNSNDDFHANHTKPVHANMDDGVLARRIVVIVPVMLLSFLMAAER